MPTHFNKELCAKALKIIHEASDLHDVAMDLKKIDQLFSMRLTLEVMQEAISFDMKLRLKYPTIDKMINIANSFPACNTFLTDYEQDPLEFLKQDYYGIICDTVLKKGLASSIEEFIERRE